MTVSKAKMILGITQGVISPNELKKIFKKQILQWHPDIAVNRGIAVDVATAKSQKLIIAYEILSENLESLEENSFKHSYRSYYTYKTARSDTPKQYYDHTIDGIDEAFINRITVKSSNVKWIDYIKDLEILVVRFKNSSVYYLYYDVPENVFMKFKIADSPGKFVHQYLTGFKYGSFNEYAEWLNVYKGLTEITAIGENDAHR